MQATIKIGYYVVIDFLFYQVSVLGVVVSIQNLPLFYMYMKETLCDYSRQEGAI